MLLGYEVAEKRNSETGVVCVSSVTDASIISSYQTLASPASYEGRHCQVRNSGNSGTRLDSLTHAVICKGVTAIKRIFRNFTIFLLHSYMTRIETSHT